MIDLREAKRGDTVHFRAGGTAVIDRIIYHGGNSDVLQVLFEGECSQPSNWFVDGKWGYHGIHPIDIVKVVDGPFDWDTVEPGMHFYVTRDYEPDGVIKGQHMWYLGPYPFNNDFAIFGKEYNCGEPCRAQIWRKSLVERGMKKHDAKVMEAKNGR